MRALAACALVLLADARVSAQAVKPWFLLAVDTSGSMCATSAGASIANSCGFSKTIRMNAAKCAIQNILNQTGDADFGLAQFTQDSDCTSSSIVTDNPDSALQGTMRVAISSSAIDSIMPLVDGSGAPALDCNSDGTSVALGDNSLELCSGGGTPTSGLLRRIQDYFRGALTTPFQAPTALTPAAIGCRPISVILLTDGQSNSGGDPEDRATTLFNDMYLPTTTGVTCAIDTPAANCVHVPIRVYPIGFGITAPSAEIEAIAVNGGTDNMADGVGGLEGYYASDEAELSEALAQIIFDAQLNEVCNGVDDDCDSLVDEGSPTYCDADGIRASNPVVFDPATETNRDQALTESVLGADSNMASYTCSLVGSMCNGMTGDALIDCCANTMSCCDAVPYDTDAPDLAVCAAPEIENKDDCDPRNLLCESPGELCDGVDNDCDGETDESPFVGTVPPEACNNGVDDDCDGNTDEGCGGCVPETCDDEDDDCDGLVDEDLNRPCGFDLGPSYPDSVCEAGQQTCVQGEWGAVCPGGVSGSSCSVAIADSARDPSDPLPANWLEGGGTCVFDTDEICDDLDNDCDTLVDDLDGVACTSGSIPVGMLPRGICRAGVQFCDPDEADLLGPCQFEVLPTTEICNTLDDDCDGFTDERPGSGINNSLTRACGTDAGICVRGVETCSGGTFQGCTATGGATETCNQVVGAPDSTAYDEDCDSRIDESDPAIPGACVPNGSGDPVPPGPNADRGECAVGTIQCISGDLECSNYQGPEPELCDNIDSDCDGNDNNGVGPTTGSPMAPAGTDPTLGTICFPASYSGAFPQALPGVGSCTPGTLVCDTTAETTTCVNFGTPAAELCDGDDNDCDGAVDEGVYGPADVCQSTPPNVPPREFCGECSSADGSVVVCRQSLIDDIDGDPTTCADLDYGAPISHGGVPDCCGDYAFTSSWELGNLIGPHDGEGVCATGLLQCINGAPVCDGEVQPVDELCDGLDNDCDGETDEFIPTEGQLCGSDTGICEQGRLVCTGVEGLECMNELTGDDGETCDGLDNDCDGFVDEGNPGGGAQCGGNTENCMRRDDPTDTGQAETEPCGDCDWGVEVCVTLFDDDLPTGGEIQCLGDTGPHDELCDGRDNDCDSKCLVEEDGTIICPPDVVDADDKIDEGVDETDPNVGADCGEDEGECEAGELVCTGGGLVCLGGMGPVGELCNGFDDDCDGIPDDGIPVGAPCGSDVGECSPGSLVCDSDLGETVCQGEIGESDEVCDSLDNDCDGNVDEGLGIGEPCGSDEGECMQGTRQCINGREACVGQTVPTTEICDCEDNDCDGEIDEDTGDRGICGDVAECVMCQCALPCSESGEFGILCPQGKASVENDEGCFCVGAVCQPSECAMETKRDPQSDEVLCGPDQERVGSCECRNNECTFRCAGVVCEAGLVCDMTDGACKEPTCLLAQFACEDSQRCASVDGTFQCVEDECASVTCGADEACRFGDCFKSCARVSCGGDEVCVDGDCRDNACLGVVCERDDTCDPATGDCVTAGACVTTGCEQGQVCDKVGGVCSEDPCLATHCPFGELCNSDDGQCELRCGGSLLFCGEDAGCVDPQSSLTHCGATANCLGDANDGEACADGLVCSEGQCSEDCANGLTNCDGECVNGQSDPAHCGATGECTGEDRGTPCRSGFSCIAGECRDATGGEGGAAGSDDLRSRVLASGGGGCACSVPGTDQTRSSRGALSLALIALGLTLLGRRRLRGSAARALASAPWLVLVAMLSAGGTSGCKVEPFCLDCPPDKAGGDGGTDTGGTGGFGNVTGGNGGTTGGSGGMSGSGGTGGTGGSDDGGMGDGSVPTPDGGCVDTELCNGIDDNCNDVVDEGADPAAVGIDVTNDPLHCGGCGAECVIPHAFNQCVDSECQIDRTMGQDGCDIGYVDLDGSADNGCEYRCTVTETDDTECDLVDDDCDGNVDEDISLMTDADNCGSCGFTCRFANAAEGGTCNAGSCVLDDTKCDDGFKNLDGEQANGCERRCSVFPPVDETCNLVDDDCDGLIDDNVAATDDMIGDTCGTNEGDCEAGTIACVAGTLTCQGETRPDTEVCDGVDNNCNGSTDESDPVLASNPACGSSVGACERGVLQCVDGERVCGGATFVGPADVETCNRIDDDCDGLIDEDVIVDDGGTARELADGIACSTRSGMLDITPSTAAVGECSYGTLACSSGQLVCRDEVLPTTEKCDNEDSDCDGEPVADDPSTMDDDALGVVCSNQLGICGNGSPGRTECVNTGSGASPDWEVQCSAGSVQPEPVETCDGEDDDCDGRFDENATSVGTNNCHLVDNNNDGVRETYVGTPLDTNECDSGDTFCSGGRLVCIGFVGPKVETCNGLDDDCDGMIDDNPQFAGTACNVLTGTIGSTDTWDLLGACTAGTWTCPAPATAATTGLQCTGGVRPAASESCNAVDDDCDGDVDEAWVAMGAQPAPGSSCCPNDGSTPHVDVCNAAGAAFASCRPGTNQCAGGVVSCVQTSWSPSAEICDTGGTARDNDCDGVIDEGYRNGGGVYTNIDNCGGCGTAFDCRSGSNQVDNAIMACDLGSCEIVTCEGGFFDDPNVAGQDCDLFCPFFAGDVELCDGEDNDCDGVADEVADLQGPLADGFCDQDGACAGAEPTCGDLGDDEFGWVCDIEPAAADTCDRTPGNLGVSNVDEDCDGRIDEGVSIAAGFTVGPEGVGVGKPCFGPGTGNCQAQGVQICSADGASTTTCVVSLANLTAVTENTAARSAEVCDGIDNDCQGGIDEACPCSPEDTTCINAQDIGGVDGCVVDAWTKLDSDTWIYQYEASRPDAEDDTQGAGTARACSQDAVRPWTNVSYDDAVAACAAAGAHLCGRSEWRQACSCGGTGTTGSALNYDYAWPSAGACTTTPATAEANCNIDDSAGAVDITGGSASCFITKTTTTPTSGPVYDLTGNVKELTLVQNAAGLVCDPDTDSNCRIQVRGGAYSNTAVGSACGYGNSFWPNDAPFHNVGFRCCYGPDPRVPICTTHTGTAGSSGAGADMARTITVSNSSITSITDVTLTFTGSSPDVDDLDVNLVHLGTTRTVVDMGPCSGGLNATYNVNFTDTAARTPTVSGSCGELTGGGTWRPSQSFSSFDGMVANGDWTMNLLDDDGGDVNTITAWSVRICGLPL